MSEKQIRQERLRTPQAKPGRCKGVDVAFLADFSASQKMQYHAPCNVCGDDVSLYDAHTVFSDQLTMLRLGGDEVDVELACSDTCAEEYRKHKSAELL